MRYDTTSSQFDTSQVVPGVTTDADTPRAWLEHFPAPRRSAIANWFHSSVRSGQGTPEAVVHQVQGEVHRRLQWGREPAEQAHLQTVREALQTDRAGVLVYAQRVLDWESLPQAERERQKQARGRHFQQQYMAQLPVTSQQQAFLRKLGHQGALPANRAEASLLIDGLLSARGKGQP